MAATTTWAFLLKTLAAGEPAVLLYVLDNEGSSPGRQGFAMVCTSQGQSAGTIGGGIMEAKFIELAKAKLANQDTSVLIKQQYHDKQHGKNQSGLICSGSQKIALIPLGANAIPIVQKIIDQKHGSLSIALLQEGLSLDTDSSGALAVIKIKNVPCVHVFGAGHVGAALCQALLLLDYQVKLYDDRAHILEQSVGVESHLVNYEAVVPKHSFSTKDMVVIVTSSYRTDKLLIKQLYDLPFQYIGMMGSDAKLAQLYKELEEEGINRAKLSHIKAPIGLPIYSKTAMEIAFSIASQLIFEQNKHLPTGRNMKG